MSEARAASSLWVRARQLLASYRGERNLPYDEWLALAYEAHEFAVSSFPEERRERALVGFVERNCVGQAPRTVAVFAVALRLFGEKRLRGGYGFGDCLEAAAVACGTTIEELPPPIDKQAGTPAATLAAVQARARQEQLINRRGPGVDYWN